MIAVVGGGLSGLVLGHFLARRGLEHIVLEAAAAPGGVVRTARIEGRVLDLGPQRTRLTPGIRALVDELGLGDRLVTAPAGLPLYVYHDGRLRRVPFSLGAALRTDLLSWRGKARALLEPFAAPVSPGETVAACLTRHFGREAYARLLGPLYGGLYASDPRDMQVRHSLIPTLRRLGVSRSMLAALARRAVRGEPAPPACSFRDGMQTLPTALRDADRERVRLNDPVRALEPENGGYRVATEHDTLSADRVVLTVPAAAAAGLLRGPAPDAAARLARLEYNPLAVVHLRADCDLRGLGCQVSFAERLATRGVTWNDSLFGRYGREGVYTSFLGGAARPEIVDLPDARVGEVARREFGRITGGEARVLHVSRVEMPAWDGSWEALEGLRLPPGVRLLASYESRPGIPGRLRHARELAEELAGAVSPGSPS